MGGPIRRILVVGGGTAGWLSAAYLRRALPEQVEITLVESKRIGRIGVGEATIPTMGSTMRFLGFSEADWMPVVGATHKAAIRFVGWSDPAPDGTPHSYWHPFGTRPEPSVLPYEAPFFPEVGLGFSILQTALKRRLDGDPRSIAEQLLPTPEACLAQRAPRHPERPELDLPTAYHIDAVAFADFLRDQFIPRGVRHIEDDVVDVVLDDAGRIDHVKTAGGLALGADLFLDCTGFRGALLNKALGEPFEPAGDHLLVDRAVAIGKANDPENEGIDPYTTVTALDHGWTWHIPLFRRTGCGYVYSSAHTTPEAAEAELRAHLGPRAMDKAIHLKMRVGRTRRMWVQNCVGVGLSAAFLEPLESTGIFFIEFGLAMLLRLFPERDCDAATVGAYNEVMAEMYRETRDFILLHYLVNGRTDSAFWRDARAVPQPPSMAAKMALFSRRLPALDAFGMTIFRAFNYTCILDGCGALPRGPLPLLEHLGHAEGEALLAQIAAESARRVEALPDNYQYLRALYEGRLSRR